MTELEAREHLASAFTLLCRAIANDTEFTNKVVNEHGILTMRWKPMHSLLKDPADD